VRRVAANILKSSRGQPTRGGPPAWGFGDVLTIPYSKNVSSYGMLTQKALELG